MFSLAIGWEMRSRIDGNPCEGIKRNQEVKRKRYLKPDELARLMTALDGLADQQAADIVRLLLADRSPQRRGPGDALGSARPRRWQVDEAGRDDQAEDRARGPAVSRTPCSCCRSCSSRPTTALSTSSPAAMVSGTASI